MSDLLCLGFGYSAVALARRLRPEGWRISGTTRDPAKAARLGTDGFDMHITDGPAVPQSLVASLKSATHLLVSASPDSGSDPFLHHLAGEIAAAPNLRRIGYLSTVGVYGDWLGAEVDERTPPRPVAERGKRRLVAEDAWLKLGADSGKTTGIFRLAGIYGPGQNALENLKDGTAKRIVKQGQVFNRIHVDDIAATLMAAIARQSENRIYNVTDDEPAPPQDVVTFAAGLLGVEPPPAIPYEDAEMTPMARSFYSENKRVSNRRIREELQVQLAYPTYREGMRGLHASMEKSSPQTAS